MRITSTGSPGGAAVFHLAGRAEFVGRARELATLTGGLQSARAGRGSVVLLAGEPGIGKTRTAEELAGIAASVGARVLWGRCYEGEGAPAFWPWVQVIRAYTRGVDARTIRAQLGAGASIIAAIAPVVRERLPDLPPTSVEDEHARFRLFEAVTAFIQKTAEDQPVVIVLDDLHWADTPSLLLLQFLGAELNASHVFVVGTYRDIEVTRHHPLTSTLAALTRQGAERILLSGFHDRDVARYVELLAGRRLSPALLARLQRETEGNPFFVTEVVRLIAAEGRLATDGADDLTIPDRVREVILERVDRLSVQSQQLLSIAAVLGRDFRVSTLSRVRELDGKEVHRVLEEAETARVIGAVANDLGRYRFAHALIRETLYEELTTAARIRLHRRAGEALEVEYAADPEPHLAELAFHFVQAAATGDAEKAIAYATRAAERAMALLAYEEAARHYQIALQALDRTDSDEDRRCNLLLTLAEAWDRGGEREQAKDCFRQAATLARHLGSAERLAHAALGFCGPATKTGVADSEAIGLLEDALDALGDADSGVRARVLARLAGELVLARDPARRAALSTEAVAIARRVGDGAALAVALDAWHWACWTPANLEARLAATAELVELAEQAENLELALEAHHWRLADLVELGDITAAGRERERHAQLAEQSRQPYYRWVAVLHQVSGALLTGRFEAAESLLDEALAIGGRVHPEMVPAMRTAELFACRREQGQLAELEKTYHDYTFQVGTGRVYRCVLAWLYCELGRVEEARYEFEQLAADEFASVERDYSWFAAMAALTETCAFLGDTRRAVVLFDLLHPYAGRNVVTGRSALCFGTVDSYLGRLATTMARWDVATLCFDRAVQMTTTMGAWPLLARVRFAYAQMLHACGRPADRARGQALLDQVLSAATDMNMIRLAHDAGSLKQVFDRYGRPAAGDARTSLHCSHNLTPREVEVLCLLAAGHTTKEIASGLSVSVATVERHITNLYGKIGARGRADATAYALHHGIVDPDRT